MPRTLPASVVSSSGGCGGTSSTHAPLAVRLAEGLQARIDELEREQGIMRQQLALQEQQLARALRARVGGKGTDLGQEA